MLAIGAGALVSELYENTMLPGKAQVLDGRGMGAEVEDGSRTHPCPPPRPPIPPQDAHLQPIRPCGATVTLEAWLSLERVVGKDETFPGTGPNVLLLPPAPWGGTPTLLSPGNMTPECPAHRRCPTVAEPVSEPGAGGAGGVLGCPLPALQKDGADPEAPACLQGGSPGGYPSSPVTKYPS